MYHLQKTLTLFVVLAMKRDTMINNADVLLHDSEIEQVNS